MLRIALASLRNRMGAALGCFVALFFAATMVSACGTFLAAGLRGSITPGRFAGAPVVVTGDQQVHWIDADSKKNEKTKEKVRSKDLTERVWLPASIGSGLSAIRGAKIVSDRAFTADLFTSDHTIIDGVGNKPTYGHNWSAAQVTPYRIISGRPPRSNRDIVLDSGLASKAGLVIGDRIGVQSTQLPTTFTVSGIARAQSPVTQESALFFSESEATTLAEHGASVIAYGVYRASADVVRAEVKGTTSRVLTGNDRGAAALPGGSAARTQMVSMSAAIGGTALIVALLVIVGTFTLSIQQRYRELALLRAIGASPRQVRRLITCEALVLGLLAGASGAVTGLPLANGLDRTVLSHETAPGAIQLTHNPFPVIGSALVTMMAAFVAARISSRRIASIRPAEALSEASVESRAIARGRTTAGLIVTTGALSISILLTKLHTQSAALPLTYLCLLVWMIGVALLGPPIARGGVVVLPTVLRISPVGGFLAATNSKMYSRRVASVITPLALLIGMTSTILFVPTTMNAAAQSQTRHGLSADWILESSGPGIPAAAVTRLRSTKGVTTTVSAVNSTIWVGRDKRSAEGFSGEGLTDMINPDLSAGSLARFGAGDIAMSSEAARNRYVGDKIDATLGDGTKASFTLVAIFRRSLAFGDTLVNFAQLVKHVDTPLAQEVLINGSIDPNTVDDVLAAYPGLRLVDRSSYHPSLTGSDNRNSGAGLAFLLLIIGFCGIAVVNTLAMATTDRSREFSLLRLTGATTRQVRSMLGWELTLDVVLATVIAAITSWSTLTGFTIGMTAEAMPTIEPLTCVGVVLGAVALGSVAIFLPARALLRRNPSNEITAE